jgi:Fe-S-cluster-containing dehydrogenase component
MTVKKWYFTIDVEKCENCQNCFLSCKDEHVGNEWLGYAAPMTSEGPSWITVHGKERGQYPFVDVAYLPSPCMHCDDPPCVKAAKDGAIYKRPDGIVIIDPVKARGQKSLAGACPYHAITWNEALQLPQKCTFCAHLLDDGWTQTRCAQSCPTGALRVSSVEDNDMREIAEKENLGIYRPELKTGPHAYYQNLYQFTRCFIGGSVAVSIDGRDDCAEGVKATIFDGTGERIAERLTDNYGDFKFDDLEENGGRHIIRLEYIGHETKTVEVDLGKSTYVGTIFLSRVS